MSKSNRLSIRRRRLLPIQLAFAAAIILVYEIGITSCIPIVPALPTKPPGRLGNPTPSSSRTIIEQSLPLHEIWRKSSTWGGLGVSARTSSFRALAATPKIVYVANFSSILKLWQVIALDPKTGTKLWETEPFEHVMALAVGPNSLFIASGSGIKAYDSTSGGLEWISNQPPPDHEGYAIFFEESQLKFFITKGDRRKFSTIDPESGLVGEFQELEDIVAIDSQYRYFRNGRQFWVEEITTNKVKWVIPIRDKAPNWPIRSGDLLVIPTTASSVGWHSVVVVDRDTGQKIWECIDCYASDVAVDGDTLYAILRDGSLAAYGIRAGQVIGTISFAGGDKIDPNVKQYALAAADGAVFLYFDDSQELIALGP